MRSQDIAAAVAQAIFAGVEFADESVKFQVSWAETPMQSPERL
jgi:hypothetical protein